MEYNALFFNQRNFILEVHSTIFQHVDSAIEVQKVKLMDLAHAHLVRQVALDST